MSPVIATIGKDHAARQQQKQRQHPNQMNKNLRESESIEFTLQNLQQYIFDIFKSTNMHTIFTVYAFSLVMLGIV